MIFDARDRLWKFFRFCAPDGFIKRILLTALFLIVLIVNDGWGIGVRDTWAGDNTGSITCDGTVRTYLVHVPSQNDKKNPIPLLFVLHGGGGTGKGMVQLTLGGFNILAEKEGFIVVYPDGVEKHWNDGRGLRRYHLQREHIDDVGFISALIDHLEQELNIDKRRIYITGISNGGMMSYRLACELTDRIAAISPVASSMGENISLNCSPSKPISVLMINGVEDPLVPWKGGEIKVGPLQFGKVLSVSSTVRFWVNHNQCSSFPIISWEPDKDPHDGTRVRREVYGQGREGTEVTLYAIEGGGHTWPNGYQYLGEWMIGRTGRDIDANEVIWNFVKRYSLK